MAGLKARQPEWFQPAVLPPSAVNTGPVTNEACSDARKRITQAISSGRPMRPSGTPDSSAALRSAVPLTGDGPSVDLVLGYHRANTSTLLRLFLSKVDEIITRVGQQSSPERAAP